jgi:protein sidekick
VSEQCQTKRSCILYIFNFQTDDNKWQTVAKPSSGAMQDFTVSFQTLLPSTFYIFRISSFNQYGISYPLYADEYILTPSKLYYEYGQFQAPFYRKDWFSMSVACSGTIMIILVTAVLCVKSKSQKYKRKFPQFSTLASAN